jgi:hypothetical protein
MFYCTCIMLYVRAEGDNKLWKARNPIRKNVSLCVQCKKKTFIFVIFHFLGHIQ